ncbi:MAG: ATP-binding cassette domain-containing protein [Bacteroidales bacterium]|nr:ATP-binding cassette domain-containing protein [Bacteroidales bacterium]
MISINNLTVAWGGFTLLDCINFHISENDHIGLVGKNGAGKSTLLKLICGLQTPSSGRIEKPSSLKIGYLPQIMQHNRGRSVMDEAMTAFQEQFDKEARLQQITDELASREDYESRDYQNLIEQITALSDELALSAGESPQARAEKTLSGLGFKKSELDRPTETFSQGWNMRIELAKILLSNPDVLLLDEPTNHLDIESIEWLENYLHSYRGSLVLISHDRKFLDNVTDRTVEIMLGHIHDYKVPYSQYRVLRQERIGQQIAAYNNQQKMIEKTEEFIERFRYKPTKSNQVQSRIKALEKLDRIEVDVEEKAAMTIKFPPAPRSGDVVFEGHDLTVGYDGKAVFSGAEIEIKRGEKVALVGRNGEGKSTLMKVLMKQLDSMGGSARVGYNVDVGYYAQNQEDVLDKNFTAFETLDRIAVGDIRTRLRDILAAFLFKGEDIDKKVAVLSGGERARLAMASLMLSPHNLLALDEPTNHMDILSKDILKQALKNFDGTLLVVSHDRDFLDGLVDKIYEFRDGAVREHLGGIQDFLHKRKIESLGELERKTAQTAESSSKPVAEPVKESVQKWEQKKFESKVERMERLAREKLEAEIERLEARQKELEEILGAPSPETDIMELTREYLENKRDIDYKTEQWGKMI